jgi:uncharacterized SAM-binding protein YcdF (DUF218 family)
MLAALVKNALIPGSMSFLLLGIAFGIGLLYGREPAVRWGRRWLLILILTYVGMSLPASSNALTMGLKGSYAPLQEHDAARGARVVVVIGNGAVSYSSAAGAIHQLTRRSAFAVLEAARVCRLLDPEWIVASGGIPGFGSQLRPESEIMRAELEALGVPAERILLESESKTTAEQIAGVARLLRARQIAGPVVLVTASAHAMRVMWTARAHGLDAVPSIADDLRYGPPATGLRRWLPSIEALRGSEAAMYEYLAMVYYWVTPR